jgi:hypothetical protein
MTEPERTKIPAEVAAPQNGKAEARYCAVCGEEASSGLAIEYFGELFCSDGHAEEFVKEVRAARVQAATLQASETEVQQPESPACAPKRPGWKRYLKLGACCGAPLLAVVFLAGGGGVVLGGAGAVVPYLVALACPLGMYFMMRSMSKMGQKENPEDKEAGKPSGETS